MKLEFVVDEKDHVEVLVHGEDLSFPNALREKLLEEGGSGIEFVSVTRAHPTASPPKLVLRTKGRNARELLKGAAKGLAKDAHGIAAFAKKKA